MQNWEIWLSTWEPLITWLVICHVSVTLNELFLLCWFCQCWYHIFTSIGMFLLLEKLSFLDVVLHVGIGFKFAKVSKN